MRHNRMLSFVTCATKPEVLRQCLLASPCLVSGDYPLSIHLQSASAGAAFNSHMRHQQQVQWLIWVHQDVFLPAGWDKRFIVTLAEAQQRFPRLAVAGLYGVSGAGEQAQRAGHLLDRGKLLQEPTPLPCLVDSIDELLFAVRTDSGLRLDPELGFDFYGADLVLQAQEQGLQAAVVDAYCEHWSATPRQGVMPSGLLARIAASGAAFERKWSSRLPVDTPCFSVARPGDVTAQCHVYARATDYEPAAF